MLSIFVLLGCATTPQHATAAQDGVIHVSTGESGSREVAPMSMQGRIRAVFLESQSGLVDCYLPALERDPMRYGEIVVGVTIDPSGKVTETGVAFSTISDTVMMDCVLETTKTFEFPSHDREQIRASYPFLFTSDATPREVVRALKVRHGLIPPDPIVRDEEGKEPEPAHGQDGWYETW